uniref:Uncharacterized protein n=1 Tax=Arundo donax TaxID=35708 RepID=A0A0A9GE46_ARUDO
MFPIFIQPQDGSPSQFHLFIIKIQIKMLFILTMLMIMFLIPFLLLQNLVLLDFLLSRIHLILIVMMLYKLNSLQLSCKVLNLLRILLHGLLLI